MCTKTIQIIQSLLLLFVLGTTTVAQAGGIALGSTRVIYPQGSKQVSLPIINSSATNIFLIQSWVANADGIRSTAVCDAAEKRESAAYYVRRPHAAN
jgi:P pilus assembly chaperone PapD